MKKTVSLFILLSFTILTYAQNDYFQQQVDFEIHTELYAEKAELSCFETITYKNNSSDTLFYIYFHLWPNAYKNRKTALAKQMAYQGKGDLFFRAKKDGGYIDSLDFRINNEKLNWEYEKKFIDICKVYLNEPLMPGKSVEITTPFYVKLPGDVSRMGHKDSLFQITQWYPKPAVYDIDGWHQMPYLDQGEFYSEFGNYDVYITVPKQIVVAATGNLNTEKENEWLEELSLHEQTGSELKNPSESDKKILHYSEQNIHDFAWFCSEKYYVSKDSVLLPDSEKYVTTFAMYTDENYFNWRQANKFVQKGVYYYSDWVGNYPFNNCTAVQGALRAGGGMEYPTITVISSQSIEDVIFHEVGHNWFYGVLGFNERDYPLLDEGINTFYDHRYSYEIKDQFPWFDFGSVASNNLPDNKAMSQLAFMIPAYMDMDQPMNLHSEKYSKITYGAIIYEKMPESLIYLENYLGRNKFDEIMQSFYAEWKFKHPTPVDFENHFKKSTDKNLYWFFNDLIATNGKIDYKLKYRNNKLIIKNKGHFSAPINVVGYDENKNPTDTFWFDNIEKKKKIELSKKDYSKFIIDPCFATLEFNRYNNFTRTKGLFKRYEKFKFGFSTAVLDYYSYKINLTPFVFYNDVSKFQIGALITNIKIPPKKFIYVIMPIYSFGYNNLTGSVYMQYKTFGHNGFPSATYSFYVDRYAYYTPTHDFIPNPFKKIKFQVAFNLQNPQASDKFAKQLKFSFSMIPKVIFNQKSAVFDRLNNFASIYNINYYMIKKSKLRPFMFQLNLDIYEQTYSFWAETKLKFHYTDFYDGLEIRLFSGSNVPINGTDGRMDYKYDHFYWSRYRDYEDPDDGLLSHQFVDEYGGLTFYYNSPDYFLVNAVNVKTTLPKVPVIKFYYNFVSSSNLILGNWLDALDFRAAAWETGIMLDFMPGVFAVYLPLYGSQELMDYNKTIKEDWYKYFRFTFKVENFKELINSF